MTVTVFELWNDETNNLIDDFDSLEDALDDVRWRITSYGVGATEKLSLLRSEDSGKVTAVAIGEELVRCAQTSATAAHVAADG